MAKELKKILFVDDDEDIHMIIKICLREIPNVEVRSVFSGEEAIKVALTFEPDLILLDVMMPIMDGIATLNTLKVLPTLKHIPVVFLTAKAQKNEIEEYFKLGAFDVIIKPFEALTLADHVQQIWEKFQQAS